MKRLRASVALLPKGCPSGRSSWRCTCPGLVGPASGARLLHLSASLSLPMPLDRRLSVQSVRLSRRFSAHTPKQEAEWIGEWKSRLRQMRREVTMVEQNISRKNTLESSQKVVALAITSNAVFLSQSHFEYLSLSHCIYPLSLFLLSFILIVPLILSSDSHCSLSLPHFSLSLSLSLPFTLCASASRSCFPRNSMPPSLPAVRQCLAKRCTRWLIC